MASRTVSAAAGQQLSTGLVIMVGAAIMLNYIDRGAVSIAAPLIKDEMGLSATGYGLVVSAFFWTYVPVLVLAGWLADRVSVYKLMAGGVFIWALATLLMGFAGGLTALVVLRLAMGVGEGVAFPSGSKLMARAPEARRGMANVALSGGLAMGPLVGTLAGGAILAAYGWRPMFVAFGVVTLLWLLPWMSYRREVDAPLGDDAAGAVAYPLLLRTRSLWAVSLYHFTGTYALYFIIAWLPLYLVKVRGYDIADMAALTAVFYLAQTVGATLSGWIADRLICNGHDVSKVRRGIGLVATAVASVGVLGIAYSGSTMGLLAWLVPAGACFGAVTGTLFIVGQSLAGPASAGRWVGVQAGFGNMAGVIGPVVTGAIVDTAGYLPAFYLTAGIAVAGALVFAMGVPKVVAEDWGR